MFNKLKIYTVHIKPGLVDAAEKPVFVREGFNIYAFFLTFFWAIYKRAWLGLVFIIVGEVVLLTMGKMHVLSPNSIGIMQLGFQLWIGFQANDWVRACLKDRGYITADILTGDSLLRAEQRYFERYLAAA
jgi:hypothetical protein